MKCPECGKDFEKKRPWQKYDDPACAQKKRNRRRVKRIKKLLKQAALDARMDDDPFFDDPANFFSNGYSPAED